jgi:hypothetical protein
MFAGSRTDFRTDKDGETCTRLLLEDLKTSIQRCLVVPTDGAAKDFGTRYLHVFGGAIRDPASRRKFRMLAADISHY